MDKTQTWSSRDLNTYADAEAMDASEDFAAGEMVTFRPRILEAARYYKATCAPDCKLDVIIDAIEDAFLRRHLPII